MKDHAKIAHRLTLLEGASFSPADQEFIAAEIEDLERVRGIGRYTVNNIRPYVKVQGEMERR